MDQTCPHCMNTVYTLDHESGAYFCSVCGTQSQDYFEESHELEDNFQSFSRTTRQLIARSSDSSSKSSADTTASRRTVDLATIANNIVDYLSVYQYILKNFLKCLIEKYPIAHQRQYEDTMKCIWLTYLHAWRNSKSSSCQLSNGFVVSSCCTCTTNKHHPLFPSKPLLIGFVYLTCRCRRDAITPFDIVRFCKNGTIPYSTAWDIIPEEMKIKIKGTHSKSFYTQSHRGRTRFITASNILFHVDALTQSLHIRLPPLNAPLVAYNMITDLGLPSQVWMNYVKISQVMGLGVPFHGAEAIEQSYVEHIMAVVLMACKFCSNWMEWGLIRHDKHRASALNTVQQINEIHRNQLEPFLQSIHRAVLPSSKGDSQYNHVVDKMLSESPPRWWSPLIQTSEAVSSHPYKQSHGSLMKDQVSNSSERDLYNHYHPIRTATNRKDDAVNQLIHPVDFSSNPSTYVTSIRYQNDVTGSFHYKYKTLLLERSCQYLDISPDLLHELLEKLESQLVALVSKNKLDKKRSDTSSGISSSLLNQEEKDEVMSRLSKKKRKKNEMNESNSSSSSYYQSANVIWPVLRTLGLNGTLEPERGPLQPIQTLYSLKQFEDEDVNSQRKFSKIQNLLDSDVESQLSMDSQISSIGYDE